MSTWSGRSIRRVFLPQRACAASRSGAARPPPSADYGLPVPGVRGSVQASPLTRCGRRPTTTAVRPVMLLRGFAKGVPTKWLTDRMANRRDGPGLPVGPEAAPSHSGGSRSGRASWTSRRVSGGGAAGSRGRGRRDVSRRNFCGCGGKGDPHLGLDDPPRRRANKQRGRGTYENDRPPIVGMVGRQTGWVSF